MWLRCSQKFFPKNYSDDHLITKWIFIDLAPRALLIAKASYRLALLELKEFDVTNPTVIR